MHSCCPALLVLALGALTACSSSDETQLFTPVSWGWLAGYKFLRAEIGSAAGTAVIHLGSAGASCALPFARLGLDLATGGSTGAQGVFRVVH